MALSIGVSGVWKGITGISVGVSGAWKAVTAAYVGAGGVWKLLHSLISLSNVNATSTQSSPTDAFAGYRLNSAGTIHKAESAGSLSFGSSIGTWLTSGSASDYESRATLNSGTLSTGTSATWQALSTTREWSRSRTSNTSGSDVVNLTIEIRLASSGTVVASCTVVLTAEIA